MEFKSQFPNAKDQFEYIPSRRYTNFKTLILMQKEKAKSLNHFNLTHLRKPELKNKLKEYGLPVSGNKPELLKRLETHLFREIKAIQIQSHVRGFLVRTSFVLRGIAWNRRNLCVNENDFYTMEPLNEIPFERFYSYTDETQFTYGFDVFSLVQYYQKMGHLINPYNRSELDRNTVGDILHLAVLVKLLFPIVYLSFQEETIKNQTHVFNNVHSFERNIAPSNFINRPLDGISINYLNALNQQLIVVQNRPLDIRIQELFIEIDLLGNYTLSSWFLQLHQEQLCNFYQSLHRHWQNQREMPEMVRNRICCLRSPFDEIDAAFPPQVNSHLHSMSFYECQLICIHAMEYFVLTGINSEYRILGCMHMLSIFTTVSIEARRALPWLYDLY